MAGAYASPSSCPNESLVSISTPPNRLCVAQVPALVPGMALLCLMSSKSPESDVNRLSGSVGVLTATPCNSLLEPTDPWRNHRENITFDRKAFLGQRAATNFSPRVSNLLLASPPHRPRQPPVLNLVG